MSATYKSVKRTHKIHNIIIGILLFAFAITILFPLIWMISTALKSDTELFTNVSLIPKAWLWSNFIEAWKQANFTLYTFNSLIITVPGVLGSLLSNGLIAYGFAKMKFKGQKILFSIVLATMMIPGSVTMIPTYILFAKMHWVGSYLPLIVPNFFGSAFYIFLLRQFMLGIPTDYSEAARIEGANELQIFWKIMLPLVKPALITIAIFEFNAKWNDFMGPLLYLNDSSQYTIQMGLRMFETSNGIEWQLFMAASIIALIPVMAIFFFLQRYFIEGVSMSGIK